MNFQAVGIALLAGFLLGGIAGFRIEQDRWNRADEARALAEANATAKAAEESQKVVTVYVDRIQKVNVPTPVVRTRLVERVCANDHPPVSGSAGTADASAAPDARDRLAGDLVAAKQNAEQLRSLIEWVQANGAK